MDQSGLGLNQKKKKSVFFPLTFSFVRPSAPSLIDGSFAYFSLSERCGLGKAGEEKRGKEIPMRDLGYWFDLFLSSSKFSSFVSLS